MNNTPHLFDRTSIRLNYRSDCWQRVCFSEFESTMRSTARPFPCLRGVMGFNENHLRFCFFSEINAKSLAPVLAEYVRLSKTFGAYTSLVVFEKPSALRTIKSYNHRFWRILDELSNNDVTVWPNNIPLETDDPHWEFCFSGEPMFVVCNTPAHVKRRSRYFTSLMLTFQPRWMFDEILGDQQKAKNEFETVSKRLCAFDYIEKASVLGRYGDKSNLESLQYFLSDDDEAMPCPFTQLRRKND